MISIIIIDNCRLSGISIQQSYEKKNYHSRPELVERMQKVQSRKRQVNSFTRVYLHYSRLIEIPPYTIYVIIMIGKR